MLGHQQAAGGGGHHAEGQYGDRVCTVGLMEFVLEKGTVGDLSLVLEAQRMHSGSVGVCLSCLGQMDARQFLLGMWGFVWIVGFVSFLLSSFG